MLTQILIPVGLILIMFSIGLGLQVSDFNRILRRPRAVITILVMQMVFLPISAFVISLLLEMPPELCLGLVLIAACPGGITSNMLTRLARGDAALSVGLTVITSFLSVLSIPLVLQLISPFINGQATIITLSFFDVARQILVLTVLPLAIGMFLRTKYPNQSARLESPVVMTTSLFFLLLVALTWANQWENIFASLAAVGIAVALLIALNIFSGAAVAKLMRLRDKEQTTMLIEIGIQNSAMAFMIAANILNDMTAAIPSALYSVFMVLAGLIIVGLRRHPAPKQIST